MHNDALIRALCFEFHELYLLETLYYVNAFFLDSFLLCILLFYIFKIVPLFIGGYSNDFFLCLLHFALQL